MLYGGTTKQTKVNNDALSPISASSASSKSSSFGYFIISPTVKEYAIRTDILVFYDRFDDTDQKSKISKCNVSGNKTNRSVQT
jgi:hypothetical protein